MDGSTNGSGMPGMGREGHKWVVKAKEWVTEAKK